MVVCRAWLGRWAWSVLVGSAAVCRGRPPAGSVLGFRPSAALSVVVAAVVVACLPASPPAFLLFPRRCAALASLALPFSCLLFLAFCVPLLLVCLFPRSGSLLFAFLFSCPPPARGRSSWGGGLRRGQVVS